MSDILEVKNLVKKYGEFRAVDGISFSVPKGKVVGFLGPNGAGKTTSIQMLLGITTPTSGEIKYFGKEFPKYRIEIFHRINHASAFNSLLGRISARENLLVFANLYNVRDASKKINELIEYFEAESFINDRYWDLSTGQKTRINIIKSMLNDPELILMDEPTASLDPDVADKTLSLIEDMRKRKNLTILYTSHDMSEVTRICDEVIFLDHGKIVARDTPLGLTKQIRNAELTITFSSSRKTLEKYLQEGKEKYKFANEHTVTIDTEEQKIPKLIFGMSKADVYITDIEIKKPTLEDVFLQIARSEV